MMKSAVLHACLASVFLLLPQYASAEDDARDKLVYRRYSRELAPSPIKFDWPPKVRELDHPANKADVASGKAIFTFDGLGESRVWRLPKCCGPFACWPELANVPQFGRGYVLQAEELKVEGKWKRYFGFLCDKGATVVPAADVELPNVQAGPWVPREELFAGLFWGITVPGQRAGFWKRQEDESAKLGGPLPVELFCPQHHNAIANVSGNVVQGRTARRAGPPDVVDISLKWRDSTRVCLCIGRLRNSPHTSTAISRPTARNSPWSRANRASYSHSISANVSKSIGRAIMKSRSGSTGRIWGCTTQFDRILNVCANLRSARNRNCRRSPSSTRQRPSPAAKGTRNIETDHSRNDQAEARRAQAVACRRGGVARLVQAGQRAGGADRLRRLWWRLLSASEECLRSRVERADRKPQRPKSRRVVRVSCRARLSPWRHAHEGDYFTGNYYPPPSDVGGVNSVLLSHAST